VIHSGPEVGFSLVLFLILSLFACFKEKEKEFISSFLFEAFKKNKKIHFLVWLSSWVSCFSY
jgi:hypothetical protein